MEKDALSAAIQPPCQRSSASLLPPLSGGVSETSRKEDKVAVIDPNQVKCVSKMKMVGLRH